MWEYFRADGKDMSKIMDNLYMSDWTSAENEDTLKENEITHILTACPHMPPKYPKQFTYMIIEVNDDNSQDIG